MRAPDAVGVKVTAMAQWAPAAREVPQVLVAAKSPPAAIAVMARAAVPELISVMLGAALVELVAWPAKARVVGARPT